MVILGDRNSNYVPKLIHQLQESAALRKNVFYVAGSPLDTDDLERAAVKSAEAVFFFPNKVGERIF